MNKKELKPIANAVGVAPLGDPLIEENGLKEYQNKSNANAVGVGALDDPLFEEITKNTPKTNSNTKHQILTSDHSAITLIALVITIIVMLILVGVSVNIAINGGLFSTAKKAVTKTEEAKDSELRFMAMANAATHNEEWVYEVEGEKIPIPAGFAPTEIEGETSLDEGFVIIDAEGNEFVWIPCDNVTIYNNATFDKENWPSYEYEDKNWTDGDETVNGKNVSEIKSESVNANKGFYVARYEAGIPENADFYAYSEGDAYKLDTEKNVTGNGTVEYKPVSKKGYPAWSCINQINAKTVSENMYKDNVTVNSYLVDSHAWNYICKYILKEKAKKNITDSHDWGNYIDNTTTKYEKLDVLYAVHEVDSNDNWTGKNSKYHKGLISDNSRNENNFLELSTGASDDFKAYNIYDMAGNMWEWTTEIGTNTGTTYAVFRGGAFKTYGWDCPASRAQRQLELAFKTCRCRFSCDSLSSINIARLKRKKFKNVK